MQTVSTVASLKAVGFFPFYYGELIVQFLLFSGSKIKQNKIQLGVQRSKWMTLV